MAAEPVGPALPFQPSGRSHAAVGGHPVVRRIVQEVRPLVDVVGPGFDGLRPAAVSQRVRNATGGQHAADFVHGYPARVFGDQQVDQLIHVRQVATVEAVGGDGARRCPWLRAVHAFGRRIGGPCRGRGRGSDH